MVRAIFLALPILLAACSGQSQEGGADSLTQRQRDSIVGASGLPGAQGIQKALQAADSAEARGARLDSMRD
jgi:hypothetical protein